MQLAGKLAVIGALRGSEHHRGTPGEQVRGGMAADKALEVVAFGGGKFKRRRFGTTHRWKFLRSWGSIARSMGSVYYMEGRPSCTSP